MVSPKVLAAPFRTDQPIVLFLLLPVMAVLWWVQPLYPAALGNGASMPLFRALNGLTAHAPWLQGAIAIAVASGLAVLLASTANNAELFDRRNRMPALLLVLLMGTVPGPLFQPALIGAVPLVFSFRLVWAIQGRPIVIGALFRSGMLVGLAALFYFPYAFMVVPVWAAVSVARSFNWREYAMPLAGTLLVFYFCWGVLRLGGWAPMEPVRSMVPAAHPALPGGRKAVLLLLVLVPLALSAVLRFFRSYQKAIMRMRNTRSAFLALCWSVLAIIGLEAWVNGTFPSVLLAMPLSVVLSYPLLNMQRVWLAEVTLLTLLAIGCAAQWTAPTLP
ncbi:MAG: hypothetical protein IPJ76_08790 [Flavobacteriales bacterium]|nr:MAG: hypothetical protein IPJ76_08790 [Flavobacteriales bacterium]